MRQSLIKKHFQFVNKLAIMLQTAIARLQPRTRLHRPARPAESGRSRALVSAQFGIDTQKRINWDEANVRVNLVSLPVNDFNDAKKEGKTEEELLKHLNAAADYYQQALALLPPDAVDDLAVTHNQLGNIYNDAGDLERALESLQQCSSIL